MDNNSIENTDLAKQYQDILDRYSKELSNSSNNEVIEPKPEPVEVIPEIPVEEPTIEPTIEPVVEPVVLPPAPVFESIPPSVLPPTNNIYKYVFYVSLLIFLGVLGTIVYFMVFIKPKATAGPEPTPTLVEVVVPTSTEKFCEANGQQFKQGETFKAADGCNSCSCGPDLTITCTLMACEATPSTGLTPTTKTTPTSKVSSEAVKLSKYDNQVYKYSFEYPSSWTLVPLEQTEGREFSFNLPNGEVVNGVVFKNTGAKNRSTSTLKEFTLADNSQLLVTYVSCNGPGCTMGSKDLAGFKNFLNTFKLVN